MISASNNNCAKDVVIAAIIVTELKLCDIQRHVFGADLVKCPDYAALEDRSKSLQSYSYVLRL